MSDHPFENHSIIITGASRGIGWELARQLATQGAHLALAARQSEKLEELATLCKKLGGEAVAIPADVTESEQCRMLVNRTIQAFEKIDVLVNNAGSTMWARFDEISDLNIFEKILRVNYLGSVYCTYYALPYIKQSRGRIVGVSSLAGKTGVPKRSGYSASKHAMVGFFDSLRIELRGTGVSVTMIYPGFVGTGSQARGFGPDGKPLGHNPLQADKVMSPEDCARLTLRAIAARRREEVMSLRGKFGQWLKLIAPGLVDRIANQAIEQGK